MSQSPTTKILCFSILLFINGIIAGILFCNYNHKEHPSVVYDIQDIADSINAANSHSDTVIKELKGEIKYEKGKLIEKFIAIDSLSFDSSYKLWEQSARQYKPFAN